jgi:hypothetical protein
MSFHDYGDYTAVTFRRRRTAVALVLCASALALTGCVPDSGGVGGRLERGLDSATSATQTARLALTERRAGRTTAQQAHTVIDDAITKLGEEASELATIDPETARERRWRVTADGALSSADHALKDARSAAGGTAGIRWSQAIVELDKARESIDRARKAIVKQAGEDA